MNIVFILVDTLRADHLGCYGYPKPTTPFLDSFAQQSVVFDRFFAPGIPTTPAHTTIYTGLHPISHNIVAHGGTADLDRRIPVLPELLQSAGYSTCAVDNLFDIKPWLARGYEFYINPSHRHRVRLLVSCEETNRRAIAWLRGHAHERFFLFVHYWEPHTPYLPPEKYRVFYDGGDPRDPENRSMDAMRETPFWGMWGDTWFQKLGGVTDTKYIEALYDGEIRHADDGVAELVGEIDRLGLVEDTLVLVTADHGEVMTRNGITFDHHGLYDENIRVPLIVRAPDLLPVGARESAMLLQTDLLPTLCEWAGAKVPDRLDGQSFAGIAKGKLSEPIRDRFAACECTWQAKWALRTDTAKLILSREPDAYGTPMRELYDLAADPGETRNLAEGDPRAPEMERDLEAWITAMLAKNGRSEDPLRAQGISLGKRWETFRASQR